MNIINLTPHAINVVLPSSEYEGQDKKATYEPSGSIARIDMEMSTDVWEIDGFPTVKYEVVGHNLPEPTEGIYLLVSAMVLAQAKSLGRTDCIAPDTNYANRNEKGHIISVPGFVR